MYNTTCDKCKKQIENEKESVYIRYTNRENWILGRNGHFCKNCGKFLIAYVKKQKWWKCERSAFEKEWGKKTNEKSKKTRT